ncbi:uncharacterized protein B0H18DRAFT_394549 [Fomitopsis serialis]|uniref:uncharacterized protein n=1 Tax=Fomitopsis serialis TaxID=139415 RepID=UPI0020073B93|nr:uncharacterized protein B0H18DRAFT_394549 [Neoantrodia serialis]KAH9924887.1 hypothetical protein B0H18DRAFT_394549 [Neoantrodia serialis]
MHASGTRASPRIHTARSHQPSMVLRPRLARNDRGMRGEQGHRRGTRTRSRRPRPGRNTTFQIRRRPSICRDPTRVRSGSYVPAGHLQPPSPAPLPPLSSKSSPPTARGRACTEASVRKEDRQRSRRHVGVALGSPRMATGYAALGIRWHPLRAQRAALQRPTGASAAPNSAHRSFLSLTFILTTSCSRAAIHSAPTFLPLLAVAFAFSSRRYVLYDQDR